MSWTTLRTHAQKMGFDVAYRTRPADGGGYNPELHTPPNEEGPWLCVGSFEHVAGVWVQPITAAARDWPAQRVCSAMANSHAFIAPLGDYDDEYSADFLATGLPALNAVQNPDAGCMPA